LVKYLIQNTWTVSIDLYSERPPVELGRNIHYPQTIAVREMDESIPPTRRTQCVFRLTIACFVTSLLKLGMLYCDHVKLNTHAER
jgi:hypothetical protein